jgi:hypothetical protein
MDEAKAITDEIISTHSDFAEWVKGRRWKFASTMAKIPHSYTLRYWGDRDSFRSAVRFILDNGYDRRFYSKTFRSYNLGTDYFWTHYDDDGNTQTVNGTILINRAFNDNPEINRPPTIRLASGELADAKTGEIL